MAKNLFTDYDGFVEKFKPKKTTDDCYTPPAVYDVVLKYVSDRVDLTGKRILRPFYPGGDFENEDYTNAVVIDNPPFSILAKIKRFYIRRNIPFFLFAPTLTLFISAINGEQYVVTGSNIIYDNGAKVNTSFVTNMWGNDLIVVDGCLREQLETACKREPVDMPKYKYPDNVISGGLLQKICRPGIKFSIKREEAVPIKKLDYQGSTAIFGGGYLLNSKAAAEKATAEKATAEKAAAIVAIATAEKAAAEKAAAEKAIKFKLSPRELRIIEELDKMTQ